MALMLVLDHLKENPSFFIGVATVFGLLVGSFLNVVIYRLPVMMEREWLESCRQCLDEHEKQLAEQDGSPHQSEENPSAAPAASIKTEDCNTPPSESERFNLVVPRSRCPKCGKLITALQNIPIISYLVLGGKCGHCKTKISARYPMIEAFCGLLTALVAYHFGVTWEFLAACFFTWTLLAASFIDYDHYLLPDQMTLPLMWAGLLIATQNIFVTLPDAVLGAAFGYLSLWCVFWIFKICTGKDGMGYGDFKLLAALGAWCGWESLASIIVLSSLVGAVLGISLIICCGRDRAKPIPFGPYLATAGWLYFLYAETIDVRQWLF